MNQPNKLVFHILLVFTLMIGWTHPGNTQAKRALFLGNSYTNYHNLPGITSDFAASMGDSLIVDMNTPGGYRLKGHSTNNTSLNKINEGQWDYVVLQEQSQYPSFPQIQVEAEVYPYAAILDSLIQASNPCAETVFYMTWGRKNGDASNCPNWPPVCTYEGMDSLLRLRYMEMGVNNNAIVSPVGAVWRNLRENHPEIELYAGDGSHPSVTGSYAAACCFYTVMFRKDPIQSTFTNGIDTDHAATIRNVVSALVYEQLEDWSVGLYDMKNDFSFEFQTDNIVSFTNASQNFSGQLWDFGFTSDTSANPEISFPDVGVYTITLITYNDCGDTLSSSIEIDILTGLSNDSKEELQLNIFPNPASNVLIIEKLKYRIDSVQIFQSNGILLKEQNLDLDQYQIDIRSLNPGVYWVRLFTGGKEITKKFIKY